jgi:ribosomal protein L15
MKLHQLPKTTTRAQKRLGRGYGSGKGGHTSSRGQKGDLARGSVPAWFEGGQLPQIRRFPFQRGKLRFKSLIPKPVLITLSHPQNPYRTRPHSSSRFKNPANQSCISRDTDCSINRYCSRLSQSRGRNCKSRRKGEP